MNSSLAATQRLSDGELAVSYTTNFDPPPGSHVLATIDHGGSFTSPAAASGLNYSLANRQLASGLVGYQQFCIGRHDGFVATGLDIAREAPAASAVGNRGSNLVIFFLATTEPVARVENPRQVSAYRYPLQYGPRSPSFTRALLTQDKYGSEQLYVSGTASVVGHESVHDEVEQQTEETLLNLRALIDQASHQHQSRLRWSDASSLKVYLRKASEYSTVREIVSDAFPNAPALYLEADICRRELKVEIEGIWSCQGTWPSVAGAASRTA